MGKPEAAVVFFDKAKKHVIQEGYSWEIEICQNRYLKDIDAEYFALEFAFCTMSSSGLVNQVVQKYFDKFVDAVRRKETDPFSVIPNGRQRRIISVIWENPGRYLEKIKSKPTDEERIAYIQTIPQMGKKSSKHLARNLGIDCIKPDRWMDRLADHYGFKTPEEFCQAVQKQRPEMRIGTIDGIFWRYCNLTGKVE